MPLTTTTAADVMHDDPSTISADAPVRVALNAILDSPYHCVIVLDDRRQPIGIATEGDVVRRVLADEVPGGPHLRWVLASTEAVLQHVRDAQRAGSQRVADLMSSPSVSVAPDETLQRVAELCLEHDFNQLPVVSDGALVGLVRRHDVLAVIVRQHDDAEQALGGSRG